MKRIHSIQYLRAIAALSVVALHTGKRAGESLPGPVHDALPLGNAGVDLFFVISGFIMWSISRRSESDPVDFLLRRAVRVAPTYWIATLAWVAFVTLVGYSWITVTLPHLLRSLAFVPHYSPTFPDEVWPVLVPGWTLTFEMFFYAMFAATLLIPDRLRLGALPLAMGCLVLLGFALQPQAAWAKTYTSPLLLEFVGGCLVAALWSRAPGGMARNVCVLAAGVAILCLFGLDVDVRDHLHRTVIYGSASVLIVSGFAGLGDALPKMPLLERLGDASYSIYVFHMLMVLPLAELWQRNDVLPKTGLTAVLFVLVTMFVVCSAGLWLFRTVETPLNRTLSGLLRARHEASKVASR
ncbi:acyltransferase family protein [Salipiger mangrovisoli]|uniref:Acyltransferase n=1 Tax=Salipiger mangrovisoli TaxID=2865933 RepID=A0ABR9X0J7_9RHOB|nr:acyltransferase [Salipiger mangrovisoli]MBE9637071.1 acyltransferase [Salipiger mangrovisoli]